MRIGLSWFVAVFLLGLSGSSALAQVTPQNFGMNLITPLTTSQKVFSGQQRMAKDNWDTIELTRGGYDWVAFDADLAKYASQGATITYTFVGVPGWANGNAGRNVPPTDYQDFFDFVTQIVLRANGRIKYWEIWNEADASIYWAGTQADMLTIAQGVYEIVHFNCSYCQVLTPSGSVNWGVRWMQSYLALGGGTYADVINIHCYPAYFNSASFPVPTRPEQMWNEIQFFTQTAAYYGQSAKPLMCDEGSWGAESVAGMLAAEKPPYTAIWLSLFASAGVPSFWFTYNLYDDGAGAWGTLTDQASWLTPAGVAYRITEGWLSGAAFTTPITRTATTNLVRNPTGTGMVAGTPGTPPTNWSVGNPDSAKGVSTQFVGSGTEGGVAYVDWRVFGTPTSGAAGFVQLSFENATQIAGVNGSFFTLGGYVKLQAGSLTNTAVQFTASEDTSGGAYIDTVLLFNLYPLPAALNAQYQEYGFALKNASAASLQPSLTVYTTVGQAMDVTLRIGTPKVDTGSIWSGVITRPGGYQAQIVWSANGGPTTYTPDVAYTFQRTLSGGSSAAFSGDRTLTNSPILLENQQGKSWIP